MKKLLSILALAVFGLSFTSCIFFHENNTSNNSNNGNNNTTITIPEQYKDFYNYPTGKQNSKGTLTLENQINFEVLVFTSTVEPQNYIGTIPAASSITVKLDAGKFYNIVAVQKEVYDEKKEQAAQTTKLAYYSDTQAYTVSVSPENLVGDGKWIFNNSTNYWVSIEHTDGSGNTFAVIAPNARRVVVPMKSGKTYDYKIVYKQELKYNNVVMALVDKSLKYQNDTAYFNTSNNFQFETDLSLENDTSTYDDLLPSVQFTNATKKTLRIYNGNIQLSNFGEINDEEYVLGAGDTAFFTGFKENSSSTSLGIRSTAWDGLQSCTEDITFEKGKVYLVTLKNLGTDETPVFEWVVTEKNAIEVYK